MACRHGRLEVVKVLFRPESLALKPSPLWISCCYLQLECADFLMTKMTPEQIAERAPDGSSPLQQLLSNSAKHQSLKPTIDRFILKHAWKKMGVRNALQASILFDNSAVFQHFISHSMPQDEVENLAKIAALCENTEILAMIIRKYSDVKTCIKSLGLKYQKQEVYKFLGLQPPDSEPEPQLVSMSRRFPKFNDSIEATIPPLPLDAEEINIQKDIVPHLKDRFCTFKCFRSSMEQGGVRSMPISKWIPTPCSGDHAG